MTPAAELVHEKIEQVERDLIEVDGQEEIGELDAATAGALRATYRAELDRLRQELDEIEEDESPIGPDRRRVTAGVVVLLIGFAAVTALLLNTVRAREPGELATGGIATDVLQGGVDLAAISNEEMEAVVAENPDVPGMRLALAGRYFEAGEFDKALPHFLTVLEQDEDNPEALASIGWMTHLSGRSDVAETFVERALAAAPEYAQAYWFLGNIRLFGLADAEGSVEPFTRLLEFPGIPEDIRSQAEEFLEQATS